MKTIGIFINTYLRPSETFIYQHIISLKKYSAEILTRGCHPDAKDIFPYDKINTIMDNSNLLLKGKPQSIYYTLTRYSPYFESVITSRKIQLIHAHYGISGVYALPLAQKFQLPLVVTFHGHDITRLPKPTLWPPAWFNYWLFFEDLKKCDGVIFHAVSEFIRKKLIEKGIPSEKIIKHYLGIKLPPKPQKNKSKSSRPKTILFAGRLVEKKGVSYLINALPEVLSRHPDAHLVICGDGSLRAELERLCQKISVSESVFFRGWQNQGELLKLMSESDIFVIPSITAKDGDTEGLGMVMLEAMAMELPIIGSISGGIPEAITDGENGFLVEEKNSSAIAEKINLLLSDKQLALKMGEKARHLVEERFNKEIQSEELEKIYDNLIS